MAFNALNKVSTESNPIKASSGSSSERKNGQYSNEDIRKVAKDFEAMFAGYMFKTMNNATQRSTLIPENTGESIFKDMLMDEYANQISQGSGMGLSDLIYRSLLQDKDKAAAYASKVREYNAKKNLAGLLSKTAGTFGDMQQYKVNETVDSRMQKLDSMIQKSAEKNGVDAGLIKAVIRQESGGNPYAVSKAGAKGLMQLMDVTATQMGVRNVYDARDNIEGGTRYLKQLLHDFEGDLELALAAYNAGPDSVKRYEAVPPFPETRDYVKNVLSLAGQYKENKAE
jgi:soluble lytic murein transglycosylase-like protein